MGRTKRFLRWLAFDVLFVGALGLWFIPEDWAKWISANQPWNIVSNVVDWFNSPGSLLWMMASFFLLVVIYVRFVDMTTKDAFFLVRLPIVLGITAAITYRLVDDGPTPASKTDIPKDPALWFLIGGVVVACLIPFVVNTLGWAIEWCRKRLQADDRRWVHLTATGEDDPYAKPQYCSSTDDHTCAAGWTPRRLLDEARARSISVRFLGTDFERSKRSFSKPERRFLENVYFGPQYCPNSPQTALPGQVSARELLRSRQKQSRQINGLSELRRRSNFDEI